MKKLLLTTAGVAAFCAATFSQTSLFFENFDGVSPAVTLNTSDESSASGTAGTNYWVINNNYTGGSGTLVCLGFPFSFTVATTASQPGGISGSPNSKYLHIVSGAAVASGINCSSYQAADGLCAPNEYNFVKMSSDISTVGFTNVGIDLWWMCGGSPTIFGEIYYSTNGGTTWQLAQGLLNNTTTWTQSTYTNALWDNQATLRFGFRFVNTTTSTATEPGFSIDDFEITGTAGGSNTIATGTSLSPAQWCQGSAQAMSVPFTSTGTFTGGNVYTAQLSDASGSFASPTAIGTLTSTANTGTIAATIPGGTPAGSGYRIRVVSSAPATTGTDNGSNLTINAAPNVTLQPFASVCSTASSFALSGGSPAGGTYSGPGVSGGNFDPSVAGSGTFSITYNYVDGNGCSGSAVQSITVFNGVTVTQQPFANVCSTASSFALSGGSPAGGTYSGTGVSGGNFDPSVAGVGTFSITYSYTDGNGCSGSAVQSITVTNGVTVTQQPFTDVCSTAGIVTLVGGSPAGGTYSGTGVSGNNFDPSVSGLGTFNITYSYDDGNGCSGSDMEQITVIQGPAVTLDPFASVCHDDPFFTLTGGTPSNGTYTGAGVSGGIFDPATAGVGTHTITYTFTDGNGCSGTATSDITVDQCGSVDNIDALIFALQPNPAKDVFTIVISEQMESVVLVDMSGRIVQEFDASQTTFDVKEIPAGMYVVQVSVNGTVGKQRLLIQ